MVVAVALADIVQDQGEKNERQRSDLARDFGQQRIAVLELARAQPFELAHRGQRMPVDRVDVVEVVQHARVQIAKLGITAPSAPARCIASSVSATRWRPDRIPISAIPVRGSHRKASSISPRLSRTC